MKILQYFCSAILVVSLLFERAVCEITFVQPKSLHTKYPKISYSLGRMGEVDYSAKTLYEVQEASDPTGCSMLDHVNSDAKGYRVALLINRGNCTFSKKAINTYIVLLILILIRLEVVWRS